MRLTYHIDPPNDKADVPEGVATRFAAWLAGDVRDLSLRMDSLATAPASNYPGGSKSRVSRAGDAVRTDRASNEDLAVIDTWRAAHRPVLNTFQAILRIRARNKNVIVAQRHKRKRTIFDKLQRFPRMELARMDDIAGCRLIFQTIDDLREFRARLHALIIKGATP